MGSRAPMVARVTEETVMDSRALTVDRDRDRVVVVAAVAAAAAAMEGGVKVQVTAI